MRVLVVSFGCLVGCGSFNATNSNCLPNCLLDDLYFLIGSGTRCPSCFDYKELVVMMCYRRFQGFELVIKRLLNLQISWQNFHYWTPHHVSKPKSKQPLCLIFKMFSLIEWQNFNRCLLWIRFWGGFGRSLDSSNALTSSSSSAVKAVFACSFSFIVIITM